MAWRPIAFTYPSLEIMSEATVIGRMFSDSVVSHMVLYGSFTMRRRRALRPGAPQLCQAGMVRIWEHPHGPEVRRDRGDVLEGGHLDLGRDLSHPLEVRVTRLAVQLHNRGRRHATRVDDFDQPREPEGDVHLGDPRVVKSSHSHLGPGFPDRLRGHDPRGLVRVDRV